MRWLTFLIVFTCIISNWKANASPYVLRDTVENAGFNAHWHYFRDVSGGLELADVTSSRITKLFQSGNLPLNFGVTSDTVWLRIDIQRAKDAPAEWWLEVAPAYIGEATVYLVPSDGNIYPTKIGNAGISLPFSLREFKTRNSTFKVFLNDFGTYSIYLKLRSNSQINFEPQSGNQ